MAEKTFWETTKVQGDRLLETVKKLVHEGNVRRIIIKQGDRSVAEFPMTAGVVGAVFAPMLAAVGALAALITDCSIAVEREVPDEPVPDAAAPAATPTEASAPSPDVPVE
ncbi:MAG: DUF4342 domain-containing protein [Vicinamibacterales bacterium]|nr:DUF4342 domain-containing protein [Vicinamibacterales bacterium]